MIKKCTNDVLMDFVQKLLDNKILSIDIIKKEDAYYADYSLSNKPIKTLNLSIRLKAADALKEFADLLLVDKVNSFSISYNILENKCLLDASYKISSEEITREVKLNKMRDLLKQTIGIAEDINITDVVLPGLMEKGKRGKNNSISLRKVLKKIAEVLK